MDRPAAHIVPERLLEVVAGLVHEARPGAPVAVSLDSAFDRELGLDSLARMELLLRIEREFGLSLPERALAEVETPRDLLRALAAAAGPRGARVPERDSATRVASGTVRPPEAARTLGEVLEYHATHQPARVAVRLLEDAAEFPIRYGELYDASLGFAARLVEAGLSPGETVAIMLPTCREYLYAFYGTLLAGGIPVPLYPPARLSTLEDHLTRHVGILRNAAATILITVPEAQTVARLLRARVQTLRAVRVPADLAGDGGGFAPLRARAHDTAFLQYTSGSTGNPKGVVLTHANLLANVRAMARAARASAEDVFVSWLPLYHDMGLIGGCFATLYLGMPVVLMSPLAFLARPAAWLHAIHRHRGTISGGPNFAFELCLRRIRDEEIEGLDLASWRFAFNGAEPVSAATLEAFEARFRPYGLRENALAPVYGLAECSVGLAFTPPGERWREDRIDREALARHGVARPARADDAAPLRVVCCGTPIPEHELRIVDAFGLELPERHEGRLQFRGPSATPGYYRNAEATRALFDGDWLNTGDRAYLADGRLYITGREKDVIIRGGRNLVPYELEEAVGAIAGVRRGCVAAFGVPDPVTGTERLVVLAEVRDEKRAPREEIRRRIVEASVAVFGEPPDEVVLAPAHTVPKTSSGKIRRAAAREYYLRGAAARPRAVWLQVLRLVAASAAAQTRRLGRGLGGALFALRGYAVFGVLLPLAFAVAALAPVPVVWRVGRALARAALRAAAIPVTARGLEHLPRGPAVIAANHTSYLDVVVLVALLEYRGHAFVAKREFLANPLMRRFLAGFGTRFVERFDPARSAEDAEELVAAARSGASLVVFPEGTFRRNAGLLPFRTGAFLAAAQAGVPVVAVALRGVRSVLRDGAWYLRRHPITVTVAPPVHARGSDWSAAVELRERVRAEILRHCGEPDLAA